MKTRTQGTIEITVFETNNKAKLKQVQIPVDIISKFFTWVSSIEHKNFPKKVAQINDVILEKISPLKYFKTSKSEKKLNDIDIVINPIRERFYKATVS